MLLRHKETEKVPEIITDVWELKSEIAFSVYIPGMTKFMEFAIFLEDITSFVAHIPPL